MEWLLIPFAYVLGSLSSAVLISRLSGLPDPRLEGSKNPGATNVLRLGGKKAAALTLLGDAGKGLIPVLLAVAFKAAPVVVGLTGLSAFMGHVFPVFFGFKGGKGVATSLGVLSGFSWWVGLTALLTWLAVAYATRISSLAALVAAFLAPVSVWFWLHSFELTICTTVMVLVLIARHHANIKRIMNGEESRIGQKN